MTGIGKAPHFQDVGQPLVPPAILSADTLKPIDITGATTAEVLVKRPSGAETTFTGVVHDGPAGLVKYDTQADDLDETGTWSIQAHVIMPSGAEYHGPEGQKFINGTLTGGAGVGTGITSHAARHHHDGADPLAIEDLAAADGYAEAQFFVTGPVEAGLTPGEITPFSLTSLIGAMAFSLDSFLRPVRHTIANFNSSDNAVSSQHWNVRRNTTANPLTITVPTGLTTGTVIRYVQAGTGTITFAAGAGMTLYGAGLVLSQGEIAVLLVLQSDTAVVTKVGGAAGGTDDQTAAEVPFTPAGNIAATDVQAALEELDTEKSSEPTIESLNGWTSDATVANRAAYSRGSDPTGGAALTVAVLARMLDFPGSDQQLFGTVDDFDSNGWALRVNPNGSVLWRGWSTGDATSFNAESFDGDTNPIMRRLIGRWALILGTFQAGGASGAALWINGARLVVVSTASFTTMPTAGNLSLGGRAEGASQGASGLEIHGAAWTDRVLTTREIVDLSEAAHQAGQLVSIPGAGADWQAAYRVDGGDPGGTWSPFVGAGDLSKVGNVALAASEKGRPLWF